MRRDEAREYILRSRNRRRPWPHQVTNYFESPSIKSKVACRPNEHESARLIEQDVVRGALPYPSHSLTLLPSLSLSLSLDVADPRRKIGRISRRRERDQRANVVCRFPEKGTSESKRATRKGKQAKERKRERAVLVRRPLKN